jgi:hypothetical protein
MPLKIAILLRVWLPLATIAAFFAFRLPTQADASPLEVTAAMLLIPALTLLAAWSAAELMFRPASLKLDKVVAEVLDGEPTEPLLLTHEFQPVSTESFTLPDDWHTGHLSIYNSLLHAEYAARLSEFPASIGDLFDAQWDGDPATSNRVMVRAQPEIIAALRLVDWQAKAHPIGAEYPYLGAKHRLDESAIRTDT